MAVIFKETGMLTDALIEAGFRDITKRGWIFMNGEAIVPTPDIYNKVAELLDCPKIDEESDDDDEIENIAKELETAKHRAEVAERALLDCIKDSKPAHCSIAVCSKWTRCGDDTCVETRRAIFIEQAEKELAEDEK